MTAQKILVAEDSLVIRVSLRRQLVAQGYDVIEAEDGEQALTACREGRPDMLLLDVEMPKLDGHGVLAAIKRDGDLQDTPVVFLTARDRAEDVVEALRLGAHDYLRKPFEPSELMARVSAALRLKSVQDELRRRNTELETMSRTDALTGLFNRRHMEDLLKEQSSSSRRHGHSLGLILMDIDRFKHINDSEGHAAGDAVLRAIPARLSGGLRTEDALARWGGEEFIGLLPHTDLEGTSAVAERLRVSVASAEISISANQSLAVTLSLGCAAAVGEDAEALVRRADDCLYAAKRAGRNRVETAAG
jgi:two-component system, cell cycle response regulator